MKREEAEKLARDYTLHHASFTEREELAKQQGKREPWLPPLCRVGLHKWRGEGSTFDDYATSYRCERCRRKHGRWRS